MSKETRTTPAELLRCYAWTCVYELLGFSDMDDGDGYALRRRLREIEDSLEDLGEPFLDYDEAVLGFLDSHPEWVAEHPAEAAHIRAAATEDSPETEEHESWWD